MKYKGVIIEESLRDKSVLKEVKIISTKVEKTADEHQTPWLSQWTLHTVEVNGSQADNLAEKLSQALDSDHGWYIDFRNNRYHFVVFKNKIFKIDCSKKSDYSEMIEYGRSVGTPDYQLPNFYDFPVDALDAFLREANLNTYANKTAKKVPSLRPGSDNYHFEKDGLAYHDTYFGATKFIGEEIVYKNGKPVWGMNYYGFTVEGVASESLFDEILRPALMSGSGGNIPVRGPKEFLKGDWKYTFSADNDLAGFTGLEEIFKNNKAVYRLYCHGGFIE